MGFQGEQLTEVSNGHVSAGEGVNPLADEYWDPMSAARADLVEMGARTTEPTSFNGHDEVEAAIAGLTQVDGQEPNARGAGRRALTARTQRLVDHTEDRPRGFRGRYPGRCKLPRGVAQRILDTEYYSGAPEEAAQTA